jgi:hypothetical protein
MSSLQSGIGSLRRIVSGGQTGADRAALDAALALGAECGGWCPAGRRAEDGPIPMRYPLRETATADYDERTRLNVLDSEATLILAFRQLRGGTALTREVAHRLGRPFLVLDPRGPDATDQVVRWLREQSVETLNVAGPRESEEPGMYAAALTLLTAVLSTA